MEDLSILRILSTWSKLEKTKPDTDTERGRSSRRPQNTHQNSSGARMVRSTSATEESPLTMSVVWCSGGRLVGILVERILSLSFALLLSLSFCYLSVLSTVEWDSLSLSYTRTANRVAPLPYSIDGSATLRVEVRASGVCGFGWMESWSRALSGRTLQWE